MDRPLNLHVGIYSHWAIEQCMFHTANLSCQTFLDKSFSTHILIITYICTYLVFPIQSVSP